jgi:hypothetical protein
MFPEEVRVWLMLGLGLVTGIIVHRRLGSMGWAIFGLFAVAADPWLRPTRRLLAWVLQQVGWLEGSPLLAAWRHPGPEWELVRVVLLALIAWWLVSDAKKIRRRAASDFIRD